MYQLGDVLTQCMHSTLFHKTKLIFNFSTRKRAKCVTVNMPSYKDTYMVLNTTDSLREEDFVTEELEDGRCFVLMNNYMFRELLRMFPTSGFAIPFEDWKKLLEINCNAIKWDSIKRMKPMQQSSQVLFESYVMWLSHLARIVAKLDNRSVITSGDLDLVTAIQEQQRCSMPVFTGRGPALIK